MMNHFESSFTNNKGNTGTLNLEIAAPLKYLSNIWRTFETPLINSKISLDLAQPGNRVICEADRAATLVITDKQIVLLPIQQVQQHLQ